MLKRMFNNFFGDRKCREECLAEYVTSQSLMLTASRRTTEMGIASVVRYVPHQWAVKNDSDVCGDLTGLGSVDAP